MPGRGDSSTDKLLRIIRGGGDGAVKPGGKAGGSGGDASEGGGGGAAKLPRKSLVASLTTPRERSRKGVTVGVDISPVSLRLVKMSHNGGEFPRLLGCLEIPFGPGVGPDSPDFPQFLKNQLDEFCGGDKGLEIWSLVSSAKAELFHINIPNVPPPRLSDTVYWTAQKEKPFDESEFVMDFEVQGEVEDKGVTKQRVLVYLVPRSEGVRVRELFSEAGYKASGLTISPIALQTIFRKRWVPEAERPCANVFVGRNWSRIDIFAQGNLVLSRGVNTGVNSMVDALAEGYNERAEQCAADALAAAEAKEREAREREPVPLPIEDEGPIFELELDGPEEVQGDDGRQAEPLFELELDTPVEESSVSGRDGEGEAAASSLPTKDSGEDGNEGSDSAEFREMCLIETDEAKDVLLAKLLGRPLDGDVTGAELTEDEVLDLAGPALQRLARQLDRTFNYFSEMQGGMAVEHMCFSGSICSNRKLLDFLAEELGVGADLLDPVGSGPEAAPGVHIPEELADRLALNLVTGLGLCDMKSTPNLLRTYKDKDRERKAIRQGNMIYAVFLVMALLLAAGWMWQSGVVAAKQAELDSLTVRTKAFSPVVDQNLLLKMTGELARKHKRLKALSSRYEGLAVLNELTRIVPEHVRLANVSMEFPDPSPKGGDKKNGRSRRKAKYGAPEAGNGFLIVEGVVMGRPELFDAQLATFMLKLQGSPMFESAAIHRREVERRSSDGEVLRFVIHVGIVEDVEGDKA